MPQESERTRRSNNATYSLESYAPRVREAILRKSAERRRANPVTRKLVARFFNMPPSSVSNAQMRYFKEYIRLADVQLVLGAYFGPNYQLARGVAGVPGEREQRLRLATFNPLAYPKGNDYWHDIAHTIIAHWESERPQDLESLTPAYQETPLDDSLASQSEEKRETYLRREEEEAVAIRIFLAAIHERLEPQLRVFRNADEFIQGFAEVTAKKQLQIPDKLEIFLRRIYDNFTAHNGFLFELFVESTVPLMQIHAREAAETLLKERDIVKI